MDNKAYLGQVRELEWEIQALLEQVGRLRSSLERCTTRITGEPRSGNSGDSLSGTIIKLIELEREIDRMVDEQVDLKAQIMGEINRMERSIYRTILIHRYINCKSWRKIAEIFCYDERHVRRLNDRALEIFKRCPQMSAENELL